MKSNITNVGKHQGLILDAETSKTTKPFLRATLAVFQVVGFLAMLLCLILTGASVWTLLAGIAAAVVTKANLSIMGRLPDFGDDAEAMDELARFTIGVPRSRR
jgi:hypothetical protein